MTERQRAAASSCASLRLLRRLWRRPSLGRVTPCAIFGLLLAGCATVEVRLGGRPSDDAPLFASPPAPLDAGARRPWRERVENTFREHVRVFGQIKRAIAELEKRQNALEQKSKK